MSKNKVYLAIPYSGLEKKSFKIINEIAGEMIKKGITLFSPISHSHPIDPNREKGITWKQWLKLDHEFIKWSNELHIIVIGKVGEELIKRSKGVQREIKWAKKYKKPIKYIKYEV